jgi:hypothetical protein
MSTTPLRRGLAVAALVPLLAGLAACGDDDDGDKAAGETCVLPTADPSAKAPAGLPVPAGAVLYEPSTQGKTSIVFALVKESSFVEVRDELKDKIAAAGWTIVGTDQESVEAEAQFSKSPPLQEGSIKVQPVDDCEGYVSVRYRVSS